MCRPHEVGLLRLSPAGQERVHALVGEPRVADDQAAVGDGASPLPALGELHLHRDGRPLDVRLQGADVVGEPLGEHRRDGTGQVHRVAPKRGLLVQRRSGLDEVGDVGDVHPHAVATGQPLDGDRIVEVLRVGAVDGNRRQAA